MNDFFDDLLIWIIILAILTPIVFVLFKRKRVIVVIVGSLMILGAIPIAIMSEISINGCCGAPSSRFNGFGYVIGGLLAIAGTLIVVFSQKLSNN